MKEKRAGSRNNIQRNMPVIGGSALPWRADEPRICVARVFRLLSARATVLIAVWNQTGLIDPVENIANMFFVE